ncbi:MAG: response regulator [Anaerolineae bacterium]|jgi:response regulator NasT
MRILVGEDESITRMGLSRILEDAGHHVVAAPDGRAAVALARQTGPDVVILDIKMPKLDGLEAAQRIYRERPAPIVLLTAYGDQALVDRAKSLPVMAYLIKPIKEKELLATLEVVTARFAEFEWLHQQTMELKEELDARKVVERAKSVLMSREGLSDREAYRRLQRQARDERRAMRDVAEDILDEADELG